MLNLDVSNNLLSLTRDKLVVSYDVRAGSEGRRRTWFAHRANALFFVPTGSPQSPMGPMSASIWGAARGGASRIKR